MVRSSLSSSVTAHDSVCRNRFVRIVAHSVARDAQADFSDYGEIIQVLSGALVCMADAGGVVTTLRPRDVMVFLGGWIGEWSMPAPLREIWTNWLAY